MNILEKLNGLNGWQRIFFAFIVFIYLPFAVTIISENKYINRLTSEQFYKLIPIDISSEKIFLLDYNHKIQDLNPTDYIVIDYDFGYAWRYQIMINKDVGEANAKVMGEKIGKAIGNEYSKKSFWAKPEQFFLFLLGAIAMYIFGWTIGWIKKGFKEKKESI